MSVPIKLFSPAAPEPWEVPVLFADEHLIALEKPAGLPVTASATNPEQPGMLALLHAGIADGKPWAKTRGLDFLMNAHSLDTEASGVLLFARSKGTLATLSDFFGSAQPCLAYVALVHGAPREARFEVDAKLAPHPVRLNVIRIDPKQGKRARTQFEVIERFAGYALVKCVPLTHRMHQIRVHLRHAGLPIAGDILYGGRHLLLSQLKTGYRLKPKQIERPLISSPALHAGRLTLPHPATGESLSIVAPQPKDLAVAVKYLHRYRSGGGAGGESG
jgi:23S rRNA pseudouridine1911/1915/1917 synthase